MTAPIFKPPSGCPVTSGLFRFRRWVNLLRAESSRPLLRLSVRRFLQSALHPRLGIAVESRSADLIDVLGEEVIRFVQKVELLRVASAPLAEAAVQAKPQPRAKRQRTVSPFRGQPRDLPAVWRHSPHQIRKLGRNPVGRFVIVR
jgi:hypothetical protein